jgi:hypothetical protein
LNLQFKNVNANKPNKKIMQKFIVSLSILTWALAGTAQDNIKFDFMHHYDIYENMPDASHRTISWNNGMLLLGSCYSSNTKGGISLSFIDTTGMLVWKKNYFHTSDVIQGNYLLAFNSSSFYVTGITYTYATNEYDAFFAKFNYRGDSLFFRHYPDTGVTFPLWAYHSDEENLLILNGCKNNMNDMYNSYSIWDMDTLGNPTEIYQSPLTLKYADQLFRKDDKYFVGGTERTSPTGNFHVKVFIDVFDSLFNPTAYWHPSITLNEYFKELFIWNDKLYLASEVSDYNPPNPNLFYRLKIGHFDNGNYHSSNTIGPFSFTIYWGNFIAPDENSLVVTNWNNGFSNFYFLDTLLRPITISPFDYIPGVTQGNRDICLMPGKKIGGSGIIYNHYSGSNTQDHHAYLTENVVNFLSLVTGVHEYSPDINAKGISIYPNPFSSKLFVSLPNPGETYRIIIHNISGQKVMETISGDNPVLDTGALPCGTYIVNVISRMERKSFKVIKILKYH